MPQDGFPRLCGGTLYNLTLLAARPGVSEKSVYLDFMYLLPTGREAGWNERTGIGHDATLYKTCRKDAGAYIPICRKETRDILDAAWEARDPALPARARDITRRHLAADRLAWLARAVADTVGRDTTIGHGTLLLADWDTLLPASALPCGGHVEFLPFLLSVYHWTVMNRPGSTMGRATFDQWFRQTAPGRKWEYAGDAGRSTGKMTVGTALALPGEQAGTPIRTRAQENQGTDAPGGKDGDGVADAEADGVAGSGEAPGDAGRGNPGADWMRGATFNVSGDVKNTSINAGHIDTISI